MSMAAAGTGGRDVAGPPHRVTLGSAGDDRLYFAQVREDPLLEIEALEPAGRRVVVVSSGGCTALSLLAAGASEVTAVDLNRSQNHLVELKVAAVGCLERPEAVAFLGGAPASAALRLAHYERLGASLSHAARGWWDSRRSAIAAGALNAGVTERFISVVTAAIRLAIHPRSRIRRMLACRTLEEQRDLFHTEWDTRRWRFLFTALLNRAVFRKTYHPAFFEHVDNPSFARHFERLAAHALTSVPIRTNYFVHHMLTGSYPVDVAGGLPLYLDPEGAATVTSSLDRLVLVDGAFTDHLQTLPPSSVNGFALSNILEWFSPEQTDELFEEVVRVAAPSARLVFRNFVGWTEVPRRWQEVIVEDRARGDALIRLDRSAVQRRIAVCEVNR